MTIQFGSTALLAGNFEGEADLLPCVNGDAVEIYPGRFVYRTGAGNAGSRGLSTKVALPAAADFTALARTYTPSSFTAGSITTSINFRGVSWAVVTPFDTDLATTLAAHVVDINESLDDRFTAAASIVASASATVLTLTAEVAGEWFTATCVTGTGTMAPGVNAGSNLLEMLVGMVAFEGSVLNNDSTPIPAFAVDRPVNVVCEGLISPSLDSAGACNQTTQLYIDTSSGNEGKLTSTSDANAVWLPRAAFRCREVAASTTFSPVGAVTRGTFRAQNLLSHAGA